MDERKVMFYIIIRIWHLHMMLLLFMMMMHMKNKRIRRNRKRYMLTNRSIERDQARFTYLDGIIGNSDVECINQLRMDRRTFRILCELLRTYGRLKNDGSVQLEEQVCIVLHILAHHVKNRTINSRLLRSGETISRYFNSILSGVLRLQVKLLHVPEPVPDDCTDDRWRWFKNYLGALDGTYIKVRVCESDKPRYRTRKGEIATNVLGVCSRDMKFIFVLPGREGSAFDSRVLRDTLSRPNGFKVLTGHYYLVDGGYTNGDGFLAPFRGTRYHLSEWREGGQPSNSEEYFNMKHASARNVIERCFGLLKMRWAILRSPSFFPIKTQCRIITACCLLHNLIRGKMHVDLLEHEVHDLANDEVNEEAEFLSTAEPSDQWTGWRNNLALEMYDEWRARRHR